MVKVLLIDDEKDVRFTVGEVLRRAGFEVVTAEDGREGLELLQSEGADVLITDIIMPGEDGVAIARKVRQAHPDIPIIAISGGGNITPMEYEPDAISTKAYLASAADVGADLTLTKPFRREELVAAINGLMAKHGN